MTTIAARLQAVKERIACVARAAGRLPQDVTLVAVSKTFPPAAIAEAHAAGQRDFGENYVQEGLEKLKALSGLEAIWHFIGPIQSNKTRLIAENFSWAHGVDREKIAVRLSEARPAHLPPLQICIQVNVSGEQSKSGVQPGEALELAQAISVLPRLQLRGLMAIPEPTADERLRHDRFRALRELRGEIVRAGVALDTLSMGMSEDMDAAIAEGATLVRIGTAIFGERPPLRRE
jgi:pyridoxal phosphate enzyme (YggS family)